MYNLLESASLGLSTLGLLNNISHGLVLLRWEFLWFLMATKVSLKQIHDRLKHMSLEVDCVIGFPRQPSPSRICVADGEYVQYINTCFTHGVRSIRVKQQHTLQEKQANHLGINRLKAYSFQFIAERNSLRFTAAL